MRKIALLLAVMLLLPLTGCWDMSGINDQAYVIGLGIDSVGEGIYNFTFQKAVPVGVNSAADSNSIESGNVEVKSASIAEAVRTVAVSSSTELNFEHLSCVIIGSGAARESFGDILEYLMQQTDVRRQCVIAVAADTARSALSESFSGEASSVSIASMLRQMEPSSGGMAINTLSGVSTALLSGSGYCLSIIGRGKQSGVSASDVDNSLAVIGAYVFTPLGISGSLDAEETDMLRLFLPEQNDGMIRAVHESGKTLYFWIDSSQCRIDCDILGDRLYYTISLSALCRIADPAGMDSAEITEALVSDALYTEISSLIERSVNELGSSALGMDDAARKANHKWYIENKNNFDELYRNSVIEINTSCRLERSGVIK